MVSRSADVAVRITILLILYASLLSASNNSKHRHKRKGRPLGRPFQTRWSSQTMVRTLAAVAHELQQEHEQVDEVEIEPQRAHGRFAAGDIRGIAVEIHFLDLLRVIG